MNELSLIQKRLSTPEGIELSNVSEIQVQDNKLFVFKGFHVLVYIRDQYVKKNNSLFEYKFHICSCETILEMTKVNRFARYVVSTRNDGMFLINTYDIKTRNKIETGKMARLNVCKNCLLALEYKGYSDHRKDKRIYESFIIDEFFRKYKSDFKKKPTYTEQNAPPNEYTENFEQKIIFFSSYK